MVLIRMLDLYSFEYAGVHGVFAVILFTAVASTAVCRCFLPHYVRRGHSFPLCTPFFVIFRHCPFRRSCTQKADLAEKAGMFSASVRLATPSTVASAAASMIRPIAGLVRGATTSSTVLASEKSGGCLRSDPVFVFGRCTYPHTH